MKDIFRKFSYSAIAVIITILLGFGSIIGLSCYTNQKANKLFDMKENIHYLTEKWHNLELNTINLLVDPEEYLAKEKWDKSIKSYDRCFKDFQNSPSIKVLSKNKFRFTHKLMEMEKLWSVIKTRIDSLSERLEEYEPEALNDTLVTDTGALYKLGYYLGKGQPKYDYTDIELFIFDAQYIASVSKNYFESVLEEMKELIEQEISSQNLKTGIIVSVLSLAIITVTITFITKSQAQLRLHHDQLEELVAVRTNELIKINKQLVKEAYERKKVENDLIESEKRFKQVAENAVEWLWETNTEGLYTYSSPVAEKLLGYKPEEIVGKKHFYDLFAPELSQEVKNSIFEVFTKKQSFRDNANASIKKNGNIVWVLTSGVPIRDKGGELVGYRGLDIDITELKLAEQRQEQLLREFEKVNKELKEFAYIVSHDLKTPLRGIQTLASWIVADYSDKIGDAGKEQLDLLSSRVGKMQNLIDGILQYSKVGRVEEEKEKINLDELLPEIIDLIAPPDNISITIQNKLPVVEFDNTCITQIFQNLLSNAIKYMDKPQGQIRVGCEKEDGYWKFSVSDNGPGIEEKYFEKIFQIFKTLQDKDGVESTGIGLSLVKKIIENHGGNVWVESEINRGSTFFFTVPQQHSQQVNDYQLKLVTS